MSSAAAAAAAADRGSSNHIVAVAGATLNDHPSKPLMPALKQLAVVQHWLLLSKLFVQAHAQPGHHTLVVALLDDADDGGACPLPLAGGGSDADEWPLVEQRR